jgi:hypothetical protein
MQEKIEKLEKELKHNEQRNLEMLQKMSFTITENNGNKKNASPFL